MRQLALIPFVLLAACGGDDGGKSPTDAKAIDAKVVDALIDARVVDAPIDAPAVATVVEVTCPTNGTPPQEVTTVGNSYTPQPLTIAQNDIVKFIMPQGLNHDVAPSTTLPSDPGLVVGFNETKCLKFTATGTFNFKCSFHGFSGSLTVQ